MKILATLPVNRWNEGTLSLVGDDGETLFTCPCRGKADNGRALKAENPERNPEFPYGDTPTGDYARTSLVRFADPHLRLGWGWIPITGASGAALRAKADGKRTGLGIHAGRGEVLMATYGCLRLKQTDFDCLAVLLRDATFEVTIEDQTANSDQD